MEIIDFKNRVSKKANLKTGVISMIFIFFVLILLMMLLILDKPKSFGIIHYLMILLFVILLVGFWKQSYYLFLYKIKKSDQVVNYKIEPLNIKLKSYFQNGLYSKFSSNYLGVKIEFKINNQKKQIIYPFQNYDLSLSPSIRYKAIQEINRELTKIKQLEVSYLNNSGIVIDCTTNIDKMVKKITKSYQ